MSSTRPTSIAAGEAGAAFTAFATTTTSDRASAHGAPERTEATIEGAKAMEACEAIDVSTSGPTDVLEETFKKGLNGTFPRAETKGDAPIDTRLPSNENHN